jgi:hypothetical protein
MEIHLSNQTESSIFESAAAGDYASVAKLLAAAILNERPQMKPSSREQAVNRLRQDAYRRQSWQAFNAGKTAGQIAAEQGIGPLNSADDLVFPDWPETESVDDFIAAARGLSEPVAE